MNITKKTGYGLLILSPAFELLQIILSFINIPAALLNNLSFISFGIGVLILAWQAKAQNDATLFRYSFISFILNMLRIVPTLSIFYALAWAVLAGYVLLKNKSDIIAILLLITALLSVVLGFIGLFNLIGVIVAVIFSIIQLIFAFKLFKSEEATV